MATYQTRYEFTDICILSKCAIHLVDSLISDANYRTQGKTSVNGIKLMGVGAQAQGVYLRDYNGDKAYITFTSNSAANVHHAALYHYWDSKSTPQNSDELIGKKIVIWCTDDKEFLLIGTLTAIFEVPSTNDDPRPPWPDEVGY